VTLEGEVAAVLDDPERFRRWWNRRTDPFDRALVAETGRRGLITRQRGLLLLTDAGKALRASERPR
jgi:hypothetical protein